MTIISPKAVALQIAIEMPSDCGWFRYPTIAGNSEPAPRVGAEEMPRDYQFFAPTALDRCIAIS